MQPARGVGFVRETRDLNLARCLVAYYSWTGATAKVAKAVSAALSADVEEIKDIKPRRGLLGFLRSGAEASRKQLPAIQPAIRDASGYDLVVLGFPVWAHDMASPMRAYIARERSNLGTIAAFCTLGGSGADAAIQSLATACGRTPVSMLSLTSGELASGRWRTRVDAFATDVQQRVGAARSARLG
jgi:flavodoxin